MSSPGVMRPRVIKMLSFLLRLWLPSHCKEPEYGWKCLLPSAPACLLHLEERYPVALGDWLLHHFLLQISAMIFSLKFTLLWPCFLGLLLPMNSLANKQKANKQNAETLEIFTVQRLGQRVSGVQSVHLVHLLLTAIWWYYWTWSSERGERSHTSAEFSSPSEAAAPNALWFLVLHTHVPRTQLPSHCARDSHCSPTFTSLSIPQNHTTFQSVKLKGCYHKLSPHTGFPK